MHSYDYTLFSLSSDNILIFYIVVRGVLMLYSQMAASILVSTYFDSVNVK